MEVSLLNGNLEINGKQVSVVVFEDGTAMKFPIVDDDNKIHISDSSQSSAVGKNNVVISGKNIISGVSDIKCGGDFRLGDG